MKGQIHKVPKSPQIVPYWLHNLLLKEKQKKLFSCGFSQKSTASLILSNFLMFFLSKCPPGVKTNYIQKVQGLGFMGDAIRSEI